MLTHVAFFFYVIILSFFVINTDGADYLKLSEVDSAVEDFVRDASSKCDESEVSICMGGVG